LEAVTIPPSHFLEIAHFWLGIYTVGQLSFTVAKYLRKLTYKKRMFGCIMVSEVLVYGQLAPPEVG
jgi:hypothetical protein